MMRSPYAMLSYTSDAGQEITFSGLIKNSEKGETAYDKIHFCALQAKLDVLHYFWIDTYCIDKGSSVELFEAMNSLFHYYPESGRMSKPLARRTVWHRHGNESIAITRNPEWQSLVHARVEVSATYRFAVWSMSGFIVGSD